MNRKIISALLLLLPLQGWAQSTWTLRQCIEYGLKNNRSGVVYANEKKIADAKAKELLASYLPSVNITGTLDDNLKAQETVIPAGVFSPKDIRVAFTKQYNTNASAQLDQTLFDQSLLVGLKANRYSTQQASLNERQNNEAIIYNIANSYYQIFVYREQLALQHANQETYQRQMDIASLQVGKGVLLQRDLDKIKVDFNNTTSQIRVVESNLTLAENQLKYDMGFPINDPLPVDSASVADMVKGMPLDDADSSSFTASQRVDFQLSKVNEKLLEIDASRIKTGMYPKLTAYARYGTIGFGDQFHQAFSGTSNYSAVGIKLSIPVLDFFKRNAQYRQAQYKHLNATEQLKLDEGKYRLEYENARVKLLKQRSNVEDDRRNIDLAESVFTTTDLQYNKGVTDLTDWLNAQNSLKQAQNNYLSSLYNFFLARMDLEKAGGTLNTFYTAL